MSTPLSLDLRVRVLAAVASGLSHRQAGERFGVSAASVSRWRALEREQGDARPRSMGGDQRSHEIAPGAPGRAGQAGRRDRLRRAVALLRAARDHGEKRARTRPSRTALTS